MSKHNSSEGRPSWSQKHTILAILEYPKKTQWTVSCVELCPALKTIAGYVSHEKKTALLSIKYCLFTRDPYNGLRNYMKLSHRTWQYTPRYTLNNLVLFSLLMWIFSENQAIVAPWASLSAQGRCISLPHREAEALKDVGHSSHSCFSSTNRMVNFQDDLCYIHINNRVIENNLDYTDLFRKTLLLYTIPLLHYPNPFHPDPFGSLHPRRHLEGSEGEMQKGGTLWC